jgi:hypothetical protein
VNSVEQRLCSGEALVELTGHGRRYLYRIDRVDSDGSADSVWFAKLAMPHGWQYLGMYQPANGWLAMTKASRMEPSHEAIRALRWVLGRVWADDAAGIENNGFALKITTPDLLQEAEGLGHPECVQSQ